MSTLYVTRYLLIARADLALAANTAASQPDTDPLGGMFTFTVPLSTSGALPAQAYICSWALTLAQALAIRTRLREQGATLAEVTPVPFGTVPTSNRFAVFSAADGWTPDLVLAVLGLRRISPVR